MRIATYNKMASSWMRYPIVVIIAVLLAHHSSAMYTFREEPSDASVQRGGSVVLHCSVDQYMNITTIVWWSHDVVISHNTALKPSNLNEDQLHRYSITGDASRGEFSLQIVNFTSTDAASYRCQIFSASTHENFFKFSRTAEVTVAPYDPLCYVESTSSIPMVGDTVDLVCESQNPRYMGDLKWMYAAKAFLMGNASRETVVRNVVRRVLTPFDYDARFMCFEQSRTCFLIPLRRFIPVLMRADYEHPQIGDNVTYRCVANKDLTPLSYNWVLNGKDTGAYGEEFTLGPVNGSHNGSVLECAVKHFTGFRGNDSVNVLIQPARAEGRTRTISPETAGYSRPRTATFEGAIIINNRPVYPGVESTSQLNTILENQKESRADTWDGLLMPFVIGASVVGVLLVTVIVLLTVFLSRQRASNRRITDAKSVDPRGPPSDCVPLDFVSSTINDSPSISIGTLKGLKNPAGCGSVDTFELDIDPESQPEYFTLEHPYSSPYYEGIPGTAKLDQSSIDTDNQCSEFDGIEVSETITPDCELTARNRRFSFGSSPPVPLSTGPVALPHVSMIVPPEFEGNDAEVESLVAAYAITDLARPSPTGTLDLKLRGGSLKRPLPARPNDSGYRAPSVTFVDDQPFRRFGSLKSLGQPEVGAMARSNSMKRPLPAKPKDEVVNPGHRTPDPYRAPNALFANIPPFLSSEISAAVPISSQETKSDHPVTKPAKFKLREVPQKYHRPSVPMERLSAATSASEGDYAEIDSDQDVSETDRLLSKNLPDENERLTDIASDNNPQSAGFAASGYARGHRGSPVMEVAIENDYAMVDESESDEKSSDSERLPQQYSAKIGPTIESAPLGFSDSVVSPSSHKEHVHSQESPQPNNARTLLYSKVQKPLDSLVQETGETLADVNKQMCALGASPTRTSCKNDITDSCQERALIQPAEPSCAMVK